MSQSPATRVTAGVALAGVSGIAAVVSYLHGLDVVEGVGAKPPVAWLIPALADLVILGASASLLDASRQKLRPPALAMVALTVAISVTVVMNVAAGWRHGTGGALVAGWPAVAFILALESLAGLVRRGRAPAADALGGEGCRHLVPATATDGERVLATWLHIRDCEAKDPTQREVGRRVGLHHATVGQLLRAGQNGNGSHPIPEGVSS